MITPQVSAVHGSVPVRARLALRLGTTLPDTVGGVPLIRLISRRILVTSCSGGRVSPPF